MSSSAKPVPIVELALLGLLALLWGSSYLFIKVAVTEIPPVTLIAVRVTIAALFLLAVLSWRNDQLPRDGRTWRMLLVQSFFNSIGAWTLLAWGQQYVDSGLASVLNSTSPIFVFLFTVFITRHEVTSGLKLFGACLGLLRRHHDRRGRCTGRSRPAGGRTTGRDRRGDPVCLCRHLRQALLRIFRRRQRRREP